MLEQLIRRDLCVDCPQRSAVERTVGRLVLGRNYEAPQCEIGPTSDDLQSLLKKADLVNTSWVCGDISVPNANPVTGSSSGIVNRMLTESVQTIRIKTPPDRLYDQVIERS
ncbi:hypothetical protein KBD20_00520 [Candidatus Saccharibacteria bacterium]|nr:hypothetical protein [Candidatus Saccharibacteria bacterium]